MSEHFDTSTYKLVKNLITFLVYAIQIRTLHNMEVLLKERVEM